jgi:hypothetical protein
MFYNVENLYDPFDDSLVKDEEFLPDGTRHWTWLKFGEKLNKMAKVIIAVGEWNPPLLVGLCEVENRFVSRRLITETALRKFNYRAIHEESPDPRGVDVVLLYRDDQARLLYHKTVPIVFPGDSNQHTRDILYAKMLIAGTDTLHVFVNHWPSKFGGIESSEKRRAVVAGILGEQVDSIFRHSYPAYIILMGDFNAEADESCIEKLLDRDTVQSGRLINLTETLPKNEGTHKFQGIWSAIDQVIVSDHLLSGKGNLRVCDERMFIFKAPFLLEKDETNMGYRPNRTYLGPSFHGGFSDHLPVFLDLEINIRLDFKE